MNERLMVVSAHAADWVWRCSGTIAKYKKMGAVVSVVCPVSYTHLTLPTKA